MKLYIPTSSRNFNCLFSEESISPKSFYGERGFGYSKWHSIPENPYENLLVLYDELKYFERPNEGFDDYPLVIEVCLNDKEVNELFRKDKSGAYLFDGTIYFNPMTTGFVFFSEQQKDIVLSKAEGSLETKLVRIYNKKMRVDRASGHYVVPQVQDAELNRIELEKSVRINKVKGFIYGYHIGNLLSVSKEQGFRVKTTQTLLDLASAIYGSIDKRPTAQQTLLLRRTILQDSSLARLLIAKTSLDSDSVASIVDEVFNQCRWEPASNSPDRSILNLYSMILNPATQEQAISYLTSEINRILSPASARISTEKAMDISVLSNNAIELPVLAGSPEDKDVAELWVNGDLADNKYKGSLASYRLDLATELTKSVRDNVYKDAWEKSSAKPFLNALRRNLNGEEFTEKWSEDVLSAISAVLMKGDTWDGLRLILISKGIQNQTMPFAFYGIINGFANLPKDFTNILLNSRDSKTLWGLLNSAVYEAINGFGLKAIAEIPTQPQKRTKGIGGLIKGAVESFASVLSAKDENDMAGKEESPTVQEEALVNLDEMDDMPPDDPPVNTQQTSSVEEDMPDFPTSQGQNELGDGKVVKEVKDEEHVTPPLHMYSSLWEYCVRMVEDTLGKKKDEFIKYYSDEIDHVFETQHTLAAIKGGLKSISSPRGTKEAWTKSLKAIIRKIEDIERVENQGRLRMEMMAQPTLWTSIIEDPNAAEIVELILDDSPIKSAVLANFRHIQKEYQPGGFYSKRNDSRVNSNVIDHFEKWCFSEKNSYKKLPRTPENLEQVKKVVEFLKRRYPNF
jgi:hypothetical protein